MTEFTTAEEALACLRKNNMRNNSKATLGYKTDDYLESYATVCEFLSSRDRFVAALNLISMRLWSAYRRDKSRSNKFTRALSLVAADNGFVVGNNHLVTINTTKPMKFKLVGDDHGLGYFLRNKFFWKDSMNAFHGEHSHSLQWLAISAAKLGTSVPITELYARSGAFSMKADGMDGGMCHAWAWLADSFPPSLGIGDEKILVKSKDNLTTVSFRSPQNIVSLLLPANKAIPGHFVSEYLFRRYTKRGWLKATPGKISGSIGGGVKAAALDPEGGWKKSPSSPDARLIRKKFDDPRAGAALYSDKKMTPEKCKFHGVDGELFMGS